MDLVEQLNHIFYPRAVAIVGASNSPNKLGFMCLQSLVEAGFNGEIYPINPGLSELLGLRVYPSVGAIPGEVDLAIIVIPAQQAVSAVEECISKGIKGAAVITGGFGEVGTKTGVDLQAKIRHIADRGGIKVIGPNTVGLVNRGFNLNATFDTVFNSIKAGNTALVSQSGGMCGYIAYTLTNHNVGISKLVGLGNRCSLDFPEVLAYFGQDEETGVIVMHIEGMEQPKQLITVAREVVKRKPIVVYKTGRGEESSRATLSHTGALAGRYEFYEAAFAQAGMIMVDNMIELVDTAKALAFQPPISGDRVAVVSVQAGPGIVVADKCRELGLRLAELSPATKDRLRQLISPLNPIDNPVDAAWRTADFDTSWGILDAILQDNGVDAVIMAAFHYTDQLTRAVIDTGKHHRKPIITCFALFGGLNREQQKVLEENHVPTYPLPERAATGLAGLVRYGKVLGAVV